MTWVQWRIKLNGSHFATIMEHYTIDVSDVHWTGLHFATRKKRPCFKIVDVYHYILNRNSPQILEVRRFLHSVNTVTKNVKKAFKLHI